MALIRHGSRASDQARGPHPYESSRSPRSTPRARNEEMDQDVDMLQAMNRGEAVLNDLITNHRREEEVNVRRVAMFRDEHRVAEVLYEQRYTSAPQNDQTYLQQMHEELRDAYAHRWGELTQAAKVEYARVRVEAEEAAVRYEQHASRYFTRCESVLQSRYRAAHAESESRVQRSIAERQLLVTELQTAQRERGSAEVRSENVQREVHQLRSQRQSFEEASFLRTRAHDATQRESQQLMSEVQNMRTQMYTEQSRVAQVVNEVGQYRTQYVNVEQTVANLRTELSSQMSARVGLDSEMLRAELERVEMRAQEDRIEREIMESRLENLQDRLSDWEESWALQEHQATDDALGRFNEEDVRQDANDPWHAWLQKQETPEPERVSRSRDLLTGSVSVVPSVVPDKSRIAPSLGVDSVHRFDVKRDPWERAFTGQTPPPPPGFSPSDGCKSGSSFRTPERSTPQVTIARVEGVANEGQVRRDREKLPKLQIKADTLPHQVVKLFQTWLTLVSVAVSTWLEKGLGATRWEVIVEEAQNEHSQWLSLTPGERANRVSSDNPGLWSLPPVSTGFESQLRAELLTVIPEHYRQVVVMNNALTVKGILLTLMKLALPSEETARLRSMSVIETPMRPAKNFGQALSSLRAWVHGLKSTVYHMKGRPDPARLYQAVQSLTFDLAKQNPVFASELAVTIRESRVRIQCTEDSLMEYVRRLEQELSQRTSDEGGNNLRNPLDTEVYDLNAVGGGAKEKRPQCPSFLTEGGCPSGSQCPLWHPFAYGSRCINCGSKSHRIAECTRPKKEKPPAKDENQKGKGKGGKDKKGGKNKWDQGGKGKKDKKGAGKSKTGKPNLNAVEGEGAQETPTQPQEGAQACGLEVCEFSSDEWELDAVAVGNSQVETSHVEGGGKDVHLDGTVCTFESSRVGVSRESESCRHLSMQDIEGGKSETPKDVATCCQIETSRVDGSRNQLIMFDTCASNHLLPVSWLSEGERQRLRKIQVRVAVGSKRQAWVDDDAVIYAEDIVPICSAGRLKNKTGLKFLWVGELPKLCVLADGRMHVLVHLTVRNFIPYMRVWEFQKLRRGMSWFSLGDWCQQLELGNACDLQEWVNDEVAEQERAPTDCSCIINLMDSSEEFERDEGVVLGEIRGSDGRGKELSEREKKELELHVQQNHVPKHPSCPICVAADGPVKKHQSKPEKSPNVLHADLGGPYTVSRDGFRYILVLGLRLVGLPLLIFGCCLCTKGTAEVKQAMQQQLSFIEALAHPSLPEVGKKRVLRIQTDRGLEFCSEMFESMCREHSVQHSVSVGYDPQSNGTAERCVGITKGISRRLLLDSQLHESFWSYAFRHASMALLLQGLNDTVQRLPPFGALVAARQLKVEKGSRTFRARSTIGRLLMSDVLKDGSTWLFLESKDQVIRASKPSEIAYDPMKLEAITSSDLEQSCWKLCILPDSRKCWIHIPSLKTSFENPLVVSPVAVVDVSGHEPDDLGVVVLTRMETQTETQQEETQRSDDNGVCSMVVPDEYRKEVTDIGREILSWKVQPATGRTNVRADAPLKSVLYGAFTNRGGGVSTATTERVGELQVLHRLAKLRPLPRLPYLSIVVNDCSGTHVPWHVDVRNDGFTDLIAFGDYDGGELQQKYMNENLREKVRSYDVHETWLRFGAQVEHRVVKVKGHRKSVAFYCPNNTRHLKREHWLLLKKSGFPVHDYWSHKTPMRDIGGQYRIASMEHDTRYLTHDVDTDPILKAIPVPPEEVQGKGHLSVAESEVLSAKGNDWEEWVQSVGKEFGSLTRKALHPVTDKEWDDLDRIIKQQRVEEVKSMFVWTIKAPLSKKKSRIVLLGHLVKQFAAVNVAELDTHLFRMILAWGVFHGAVLSVLDVTTAFLNAPLSEGRKVLVHLPVKVLKAMGYVADNRPFWCTRAMYGLRESPKQWADFRDNTFRRLRVKCETYEVMFLQSEISRSIWLIVRVDTKIDKNSLDESGETVEFLFISRKFPRGAILGIIGVYVDDLLILCRFPKLSEAVHKTLQEEWETSEPEVLGRDVDEVCFLGIRILALENGLALHQCHYTSELLLKYAGQYSVRARCTAAEPEKYKQVARQTEDSRPPTPQELRVCQEKLGSLLWLSIKTRPDLCAAQSIAATYLHKDVMETKTRINHIFQYLGSSKDMSLVYKSKDTDMQVECFVDASFSPTGNVSRTGILIHVYGMPVLWSSSGQKVPVDSTAESELLSCVAAIKQVRLIRNAFYELWGFVPNCTLWQDNEAALVHLHRGQDAPWRSKYLHLRSQIAQLAVQRNEMSACYCHTSEMIADLLTKGVSAAVMLRLRALLPMSPLAALVVKVLERDINPNSA